MAPAWVLRRHSAVLLERSQAFRREAEQVRAKSIKIRQLAKAANASAEALWAHAKAAQARQDER
jgi:hypothetical protein